MPYEKFTSSERRGLLLLTAMLTAGICAVAIVRGCSGGDRSPLHDAATASFSATTDNTAEYVTAGDSVMTGPKRKSRTRKSRTRPTAEGRERSHRDESVLDHDIKSSDHPHDNGQ